MPGSNRATTGIKSITLSNTIRLSELAKIIDRFKANVTSAHDGIVSIDAYETIVQTNVAAEKIFANNKLVGKASKVCYPKSSVRNILIM